MTMMESHGLTPLTVRNALPLEESMQNAEKKTSSLVVFRNNKRLTGTAAQLAYISECSGWNALLFFNKWS